MKIVRHSLLLALVTVALLLFEAPLLEVAAQSSSQSGGKGEFILYVGTYTREESKGIYAYRFRAASGELTPIGLVAETASPSWLTIHPNGRFLYAANEGREFDKGTESVSAFSIDARTARLTFLNRVATKGSSPCHVIVEKSGRCLMVANYGGGSVAAFPVKEDGSLGEMTSFVQHTGSSIGRRQRGPHAHEVQLSPDHRFVFVPDLGLDRVLGYRVDSASATITPNDPPFASVTPGSGPRHMEFHPNGRFAFVNSEMGSLVTVFAYDSARGSLKDLQTISTLPKDFTETNNTAELEVHPNGAFLYVSNRGHDTIAVFSINPGDGKLTFVEHVPTQGKTPRNFAIDPTGAYLFAANQNTDNVVVFKVDQKTGRLTPTGTAVEVDAPVSLVFLRAL
jgi:6-phosphogluconolactonase